MPPQFPIISRLRVRMPITHGKMTVWPGPPERWWDWLVGFPLELHPFAWDYLWVSSNGARLAIEPHFMFSTWDTFWAEPSGRVTAQALGGLFPFTLGKEAELLRGIVSVLEVLPDRVKVKDPGSSEKLREIYQVLRALEEPDPPLAPQTELGRLRGASANALWRWKLGVDAVPKDTRR